MKTLNPTVARVLKRLHYPLEVMLLCVRWYVTYPLSLRNLEEMMAESATLSSIIRRCIAGSSNWCRCSKRRFATTSILSARAIVEQDHRAIKCRTRPMLGFKDFNCARVILSGIELMHMIKKGQMKCSGKTAPSAAQQFYSLAS
jgi:transposase-like protein